VTLRSKWNTQSSVFTNTFFCRESSYFRSLLEAPSIPCNDPPGSSETNPVVLEDTTSEVFATLCWVFYNPDYSVYTTTVEKWVELLALAQRWAFKEVEQLCIRELEKSPIPPVEKIRIYQASHLDRSLLAESFARLTIRPEPLNLEEGRMLGLETTIQIAQARELSRDSHSGTKTSTVLLSDSKLRLVVQDVFGLEEKSFNFLSSKTGPPQPPLHPPMSGNVKIKRKSKK